MTEIQFVNVVCGEKEFHKVNTDETVHEFCANVTEGEIESVYARANQNSVHI